MPALMDQDQKLRAVFRLPKEQIQVIRERAGLEVEVTLRTVADVEYTHAVGRTQTIMFLIGSVAAAGKSGLVKVEPA